MATAVKPTTVRVDENLKAQLVNQRRIPFEIVPAGGVPNEETRRALVAAEAKELGLIPDDAPAFDDIDGLVAFLEEE